MKHLVIDVLPLGPNLGNAIGQVGVTLFDDYAKVVAGSERPFRGFRFSAQQSIASGLDIDPKFIDWLNREARTLEQVSEENNASTKSLQQGYSELAAYLDRVWKADGIRTIWYCGYIDRLHQLLHAMDHVGIERPLVLKIENRIQWFHADTFKRFASIASPMSSSAGVGSLAGDAAERKNIALTTALDTATQLEWLFRGLSQAHTDSVDLMFRKEKEELAAKIRADRKARRDANAKRRTRK